MSGTPFSSEVIAAVWDFDLTLSPSYMQGPLFRAYGIDEERFWLEVRGLSQRYRQAGLEHIADDTMYLNHLLTYAQHGLLPGLNNARLRQLGSEIDFFPGLPAAFAQLQDFVAQRAPDIRLEHYVVSNGLAEMIRGSALAPSLDGIWACEFIEHPAPPGYLDAPADSTREGAGIISQPGYIIDNTTKTRAIFEINKGSNKGDIQVNDHIPHQQRRIPFEQMIYIADGPSDIPVFSLIRQNGGHTCAVYDPQKPESYRKANQLQRQERVHHHAPADYRQGSPLWLWLCETIGSCVDEIVAQRQQQLQRSVGRTPSSY
ncbi:MAG: haloacid dehalogenase-like hydrolase [Planctomycetota bacterium]|nr:MAG: haloacid dehalogenase-like hydrolase [Planctomycetota bacterium]